ncbi:MAG: hypothetical protein IMX01_05660 [Limnochordaceae bacterium]|nr:hypothetical protein [Limnochordaceae bacterium]
MAQAKPNEANARGDATGDAVAAATAAAAGIGASAAGPGRGPEPPIVTAPPAGLACRRIVKEDGRYLIFYWKQGELPHV